MKRLLLPTVLALFLAGCGSSSATFDLSIGTDNIARVDELVLMSMRVIERRLESMGEKPLDINVIREGGKNQIYLELESKQVLDVLEEQIVSPFVIRIMSEVPAGEPGSIQVEGHGAFKETGIQNEHFLWLTAEPDETPGRGRVTIEFTEEGRTLMAQVFKENVGKSIAIFVRDRLISKLSVETAELKDDIVITDIPSMDLATIFAEDVNVGVHVTFKPL